MVKGGVVDGVKVLGCDRFSKLMMIQQLKVSKNRIVGFHRDAIPIS